VVVEVGDHAVAGGGAGFTTEVAEVATIRSELRSASTPRLLVVPGSARSSVRTPDQDLSVLAFRWPGAVIVRREPGCGGGGLIGVNDDDRVVERAGRRRRSRITTILLLIGAVASLVANIMERHDRQELERQRSYQQCLERYRYPGMDDQEAEDWCNSPLLRRLGRTDTSEH
jgi:hypothetical protein